MTREPWETFNETDMPFSIIIPWRSGDLTREISFKNMLNCLSVQQTPASKEKITCEVIIVENPIEDKTKIAEYTTTSLIPNKILNADYPFSKFTYKQIVQKDFRFNKSWCMNVGVRLAQYEHLIFIDADSLMGNDYLRTIKYEIRKTQYPKNQIMMLWNYLAKLVGDEEPICRFVRPDMTRALGGIWYSTKSFYWNIFGGMNENYEGYGGEDNDGFERAVYALQTLGSSDSYLSVALYPLVHQYHSNEQQSISVYEWVKTRAYPKIVIQRLKEQNLGNLISPCKIKMDDLI